jgi:hypothetical protein
MLQQNSPLNLTDLSLSRPTKIEWIFANPTSEWQTEIKSKSIRKLATDLDQILSSSTITIELLPLTAELYTDWLQYYSEKMIEQGHDVIAKFEWYTSRSQEERTLFLNRFYQAGKIVGATITSITKDNVHTQHFKASERLDISNHKNSSLGTIIDLVFIKTAVENKAKIISSSTSRNSFGYFNTIGYLGFKLKLGYQPSLPANAEYEPTMPVSPDKLCISFCTSSNLQSTHKLKCVIYNQGLLTTETKELLDRLSYEYAVTQ